MERLVNIDTGVLKNLTKRLTRGERVKPITDEENACYKFISDPDHVVGGHVKGSIKSNKYLRNVIWLLIPYVGALSWFQPIADSSSQF